MCHRLLELAVIKSSDYFPMLKYDLETHKFRSESSKCEIVPIFSVGKRLLQRFNMKNKNGHQIRAERKCLSSTEERAFLEELLKILIDGRLLHGTVTRTLPKFHVDLCQANSNWIEYLEVQVNLQPV